MSITYAAVHSFDPPQHRALWFRSNDIASEAWLTISVAMTWGRANKTYLGPLGEYAAMLRWLLGAQAEGWITVCYQ